MTPSQQKSCDQKRKGVPAGIQAHETATADAYDQVVTPLVQRARRTGRRMRRLLDLFGPGFQRITGGTRWTPVWGCATCGCSTAARLSATSTGSGRRQHRRGHALPRAVQQGDEHDDAVAWPRSHFHARATSPRLTSAGWARRPKALRQLAILTRRHVLARIARSGFDFHDCSPRMRATAAATEKGSPAVVFTPRASGPAMVMRYAQDAG